MNIRVKPIKKKSQTSNRSDKPEEHIDQGDALPLKDGGNNDDNEVISDAVNNEYHEK